MKRLKSIVYVSELNADDRYAFAQAVELAERNSASLTILGTVAPLLEIVPTTTGRAMQSAVIDATEQAMQELAESAKARIRSNVKVIEGRAFLSIVQEVLRAQHDLVIKSIGRDTILKRLFDRTDIRLLRKCPCPVWLVKEPAHGSFDTIVAAIDVAHNEQELGESSLNRTILELAFSLANDHGAKLHIVHAFSPAFLTLYASRRMGMPRIDVQRYIEDERKIQRRALDKLMRRAKRWMPAEMLSTVNYGAHVVQGVPGFEIPKAVSKFAADLVVMGTVGRAGIEGLIMGNTAEQILHQLDCSVVAVKPPGFVSPIKLET